MRRYLAELGLKKRRPKSQRKPAVAVSSVRALPPGRRVQIDATRFALSDGMAWKYVVLDAGSRACLAVQTVRALTKEAAATALQAAKSVLNELGIGEPLVVQSDAGATSPRRISRTPAPLWAAPGTVAASTKPAAWAS